MKEAVYGWYPAAKSTWRTTNQATNSYDKECLYKHWNSRYNDKPGVETPRGSGFSLEIRGTSALHQSPSPTRQESRTSGRSSRGSRGSAARGKKMRTQGVLPKKAWDYAAGEPGLYEVLIPPEDDFMLRIPTPGCHQMGLPARPPSAASNHSRSSVGSVRSRSSVASVRSQASVASVRSEGSVRSQGSAHSDNSLGSTGSRGRRLLDRAQSADIKRVTPEAPARMVKSAGHRGSAVKVPVAGDDNEDDTLVADLEEEPEESDRASLADSSSDDGRAVPPPPITDFDEVLKKYGWRAEIPGDPFNLKTPCLKPRATFVTKLPEPTIQAPPPKGHMVNFDTFFSNTIPRKPMSFAVHKEWISEVLHAKRMALQKSQGGLPYKHTNYSFIY